MAELALAGTLTPLELNLVSDGRLINEARADPAFRTKPLEEATSGGGEWGAGQRR